MTEKQLSKEDVEVYNQIMSNEEVKSFLEKTSETKETSKTAQMINQQKEVAHRIIQYLEDIEKKEDDTNVFEKAYDFLKANVQEGLEAVADSLETGWNALKDGVEYINPFASNETSDKSEAIEQKNQKTLEKANILHKGSSLVGIGMSVAQALQALEEQKETGQLSKEDVEVYNQIMSNDGVKQFLEKTSEKNDVSQIKENDTGILERAFDTVVDSIETGWNALKDGVEYLNSFTTNDTLNNAGQKVNPDATEQTPIVKDNSKDMS